MYHVRRTLQSITAAGAVCIFRRTLPALPVAVSAWKVRFVSNHKVKPEHEDEDLSQHAKKQPREDPQKEAELWRQQPNPRYSGFANGIKTEARTAAKAFLSSAPPSAPAVAIAETVSDMMPDAAKEASRRADEKLKRTADSVVQQIQDVQDSASQAAADFQGNARESAGNARGQAERLAQKARGSVQNVKQSVQNSADKASNYVKRVGASLNESIDAAEDKFTATFSPKNDVQPRRPSFPIPLDDLRAAQAREEANINDLVDELEDKVRNLDHVKDAVKERQDQRQQRQRKGY